MFSPPQRDVDEAGGRHGNQQDPPVTDEVGDCRHHHVADSRGHEHPQRAEDHPGFSVQDLCTCGWENKCINENMKKQTSLQTCSYHFMDNTPSTNAMT